MSPEPCSWLGGGVAVQRRRRRHGGPVQGPIGVAQASACVADLGWGLKATGSHMFNSPALPLRGCETVDDR